MLYICRVGARRHQNRGALKVKTRYLLSGALLLTLAGTAMAQTSITGLPASDVLGSEDTWENPTFVGGVINGGPSASSEY
jgi:hypothetical protein